MGRLICTITITAIAHLLFFAGPVQAEYPGVTAGSFSVSDSGSATYTLPISVPAGVAGMSPELAVSYDSQGSNGLMGVGFSLSGFSSSIHRCGGSHATDGKATGVKYNNADKLCLDGQRLILTKGRHWANGAVYRTELDTFAKIIHTKTSTSQYFTIYARDGEIKAYNWKSALNYGGTVVALRWRLSSVRDRSGNTIRYYYHHLDSESWLPKEVVWTGKGAELGNRKAVFEYQLRPDKRFHYDYGYKRNAKHLLSKIKTYIGSNLIKEYRFTYQKSPVSRLSRLKSVQQCGSAGNCLPKHVFSWNDTNKGFYSSAAYKLPVRVYDDHDIRSGSSCGNWNLCKDGYVVEVQRGDFVDVNNDGYVDFIESVRGEDGPKEYRSIYKNTGTGWNKLSQRPSILTRDYYWNRAKSSARGEMVRQVVYADVNGDGYPDIVRAFRNGNYYIREVRLNNKGNTFSWGLPTANNFTPPSRMWDYNYLGEGKEMQASYLIDVNGDGLLDWVISYLNRTGVSVRQTWLNTGSSWSYAAHYNLPTAAIIDDFRDSQKLEGTAVKRTEFVDLNGDGLVDLIQGLRSPDRGVDKGKDYRKVWLNTGSGWRNETATYQLPDIINDYSRLDKRTYVYQWITGPDLLQRRGDFVDVNGDGLVDWVRSYADGVNGKIYKYTWLNTGKGWAADTNYILPGKVIRSYHHTKQGDPHGTEAGSFFDINRDGLVDWVVAHKNRDRQIVKQTFLNTGTGWGGNNSNYHFPNILVDNDRNEAQVPMHFGGIMDLNGDGAHDYLMSTKPMVGSDIVATYLGKAKPADMVHTITDSLGAMTTIGYKPMMDKTVYDFHSSWLTNGEGFRERKVIGPMPLVANTWQSNGLGGNYRLQYFYYNAVSDGKRGYQGFAQRRVYDPNQDLLSIKSFYQQFPATGMTKQEIVYHTEKITATGWPDNTVPKHLLSNQLNFIKRESTFAEQGDVWDIDRISHPGGKKTYAPRIRRSRSLEYELGQTKAVRSIWTNIGHDAYLNPVTVRVVTVPNTGPLYEALNLTNNFYTFTQTTYDNGDDDDDDSEANWLIGLPTEVKVTHHAPGQTNQVRETHTEYNGLGLPNKIIVEPNKPDFTVTIAHGYDGFGNVISTTVSGNGITSRHSTTSYDSRGLHVVGKTNALGHSMSIVPDPNCDAPKKVTDANGLTTTTTYDQFCRMSRVDYPDGTWATTGYGLTPLRITKRAKGQPDVTTYYDSLGRQNKAETKGFDGRTILTEKRYNSKGQITHESLPYYEGEMVYWARYHYDAIGRLYQTRSPDNSLTEITYDGLTTTTTNDLGQAHTQIKDVIGRLKTARDTQDNEINYTYDAVGNLRKTTDPMGNQVKMGYDHAGRKIWMIDPDMGRWNYEYDVLGQLVKQTDSKGQVISTDYDKLGRMTKRTVQPGTADEQVSTWTYDTAVNGVGKVDQTNGPDGYQRRHTYDDISRPKFTYEIIDGLSMTSFQSYNADGKIVEARYPGRNVEGMPGYMDRITYKYNEQGYLASVNKYNHNAGNPITEALWVAEAMDAKGNITQEHYGNGVNVTRTYHTTRNYLTDIDSLLGTSVVQDLRYQMDAIGNLTLRRDNFSGAKETFSYDNLNRLTRSVITPGGSTDAREVDYHYDVLGNITYRSDVGIMNYGENGYGPHAITSIQQNQSANVTENVFNPYGNYVYDANGNLTSNGQRTVDWTVFNKPKQMAAIIDGEARGVSYSYGSDFQRITKSTLAGKYTRYYGGGSMEHITEGTQTFWKYYIPAGAATLEIKYEQTGDISAGNFTEVERQYLFKDHLGSTDVIVDNDGNIVERLSFNPWGERRDDDWSEADSEITSATNRGFTGHEMDDEVGLVNMNARIYDPVIGRFLSPDPIIPSATDLLSYNRYSYVRNNPLSFTDPTGFERINVPGRGGYFYDTDTGNYYQTSYSRACHSTPRGCFESGDPWIATTNQVTDPGLVNHLNQRIGVYQDIVENYGGVSRGNAKETRNNAYQQARNVSGCLSCSHDQLLGMRGHSAEFDAHLNRAAAANDIYSWLKRKARKRYARMAIQLASVAVSGSIGAAATGANATVAAFDVGLSQVAMAGINSGLDPKAVLAAAMTVGLGGPLSQITAGSNVLGVMAHGVVGGVASEIVGGSFANGFVGSAVGKGITVGGNILFDSMSAGHFHAGQFAATVGGAALAAELAGGDPLWAATQAAVGYLTNQLQSTTNQALEQALTADGGASLAKQLGLPERARGSYVDQYGTRGGERGFTSNPWLNRGYQDRINNRPQNFPDNVPSVNNEAYGIGWLRGGG